jgi:hypothetical protein
VKKRAKTIESVMSVVVALSLIVGNPTVLLAAANPMAGYLQDYRDAQVDYTGQDLETRLEEIAKDIDNSYKNNPKQFLADMKSAVKEEIAERFQGVDSEKYLNEIEAWQSAQANDPAFSALLSKINERGSATREEMTTLIDSFPTPVAKTGAAANGCFAVSYSLTIFGLLGSAALIYDAQSANPVKGSNLWAGGIIFILSGGMMLLVAAGDICY